VHMTTELGAVEDTNNRTETGQTKSPMKGSRLAKTHQDYWRPRLKRRSYIGRDGVRVEIPEWQVRMFYLTREAWFNLGTANQSAAAVKARDIYVSLVSLGWNATLAKFKPDPVEKADVASVGAYLADVAKRSHIRPRTLHVYATKFRKLVADIAKVETGLKKKARQAKHDYHHGGRKEWLSKVEAKSLNILTPEAIAAWRNTYVARAGSDPMRRKSAERSAASILRCCRALFTADVTSMLKVKLPPYPFAGVKLRDPGPQRYHSEVNPEWLLACAERELLQKHTQQYLGLYLCLWAGLRRKEADLLLWEQVDLEAGQLHVRRTHCFEPKTEESQRVIDLAPSAVEVLRKFRDGCVAEFVMDGTDPDPTAVWPRYRCQCTWRKLLTWLKGKGVRHRNAIHTLRKESGSLIASNYGIEAARQHLGHRDIRTTSSHYVDKKKRIEVSIGPASEIVNAGKAI
jgi:integrase